MFARAMHHPLAFHRRGNAHGRFDHELGAEQADTSGGKMWKDVHRWEREK
jgi:hypothetical protein